MPVPTRTRYYYLPLGEYEGYVLARQRWEKKFVGCPLPVVSPYIMAR